MMVCRLVGSELVDMGLLGLLLRREIEDEPQI
jgi:hypothetical protein